MIAIIDYGMGNLGSVANMFKRIGVKALVTSNHEDIRKASKILLPGVGAFDSAMRKINETGLREVLDQRALVDKVPVLGICLGMQLLTDSSEEGVIPGLGWIKGKAFAFKGRVDKSLKIPHMGWNIAKVNNRNALTNDFQGELRYYFVHSYFIQAENPEHSMMKTSYGLEYDSAISRENIFGAQFHPEKSHKFGMKLFENFAKI